MNRRTAGALVATLLALASLATAAQATEHEPEPPKPRVVVAVVDSALNPYHEFFHAGGPLYGSSRPDSVTPDVLEEFGIGDEHILKVTRTGNFASDFAADRAQYDNRIAAGQPYWYEGTNVIGISFNTGNSRLRPESGSTHGIGVAAAVLTANPEAIVVVVESPSGSLPDTYAMRPPGETWAFNHPAVDITSHSYGPPYSPPLGYHLVDGHKGVVRNGKLLFGAADNSPALSPIDATSGPWWTIGVAGYGEFSHEGKDLLSGSLPDFVGDWTQTLPYCRNCESGTSSVSGTSFATPRSAGVASKILLEARRAAGHLRGIVTEGVPAPRMVDGDGLALTNWQIRRALEEAAYYPTQAEHNGTGAHVPVIDAAPWSVAGWGAISADPKRKVVAEALAHLGVTGTPTRFKDDAACAFMTANMEARRAYWDHVAVHSQGDGSGSYVAC